MGRRIVSVGHAAARGLVRLADGRTARLVRWPASAPIGRRSKGEKARVQLPSGAYLSVPIELLELIEGDT